MATAFTKDGARRIARVVSREERRRRGSKRQEELPVVAGGGTALVLIRLLAALPSGGESTGDVIDEETEDVRREGVTVKDKGFIPEEFAAGIGSLILAYKRKGTYWLVQAQCSELV